MPIRVVTLRRQVSARTAELQQANADLEARQEALMRSEERLIGRQEQLHLALQSAGAGSWLWNIETNESAWSDEVWWLCGVEKRDTPPSVELWCACIDQRDLPAVETPVSDAKTARSGFETIWRVQHSDVGIGN